MRTPDGRLSIPRVPDEAGVYRFSVDSSSGTEVYIGETLHRDHRLQRNYANKHSGHTNVRVRGLLNEYLDRDSHVLLSIVDSAELVIDHRHVTVSLHQKHIRRLIENAALADAFASGHHVHNTD